MYYGWSSYIFTEISGDSYCCRALHSHLHNRLPLFLCLLISRREKTLFYCAVLTERCIPVSDTVAKLRSPPLHLNIKRFVAISPYMLYVVCSNNGLYLRCLLHLQRLCPPLNVSGYSGWVRQNIFTSNLPYLAATLPKCWTMSTKPFSATN